jgi:hypothetical protein
VEYPTAHSLSSSETAEALSGAPEEFLQAPVGSSRSPLVSNDPSAQRFVSVPSIRRIQEAMLKNVAARKTVVWEKADFTALSQKQLDAIQLVVSSLLYAESHGGEVLGNLLVRAHFADISDAFAIQILDESHHAWLLTRYLLDAMKRRISKRPVFTWLAVAQMQRVRDPLMCAMAAGFYVECGAAEVQSELIQKVDEPLLNQIFRAIYQDESRHQALGRESVMFLLDTPRYKAAWRRERAKMYRHFLDFYSQITLNQFSVSSSYFGIDINKIHQRTLERVDAAIPL